MIEGLPAPVWAGLVATGWGIVAYVVRKIVVGDLVPRKQHEDLIRESQVKDAHIRELTTQNTAMLNAFGPTLTDFLRSLRNAAGLTSDAFRAGDD